MQIVETLWIHINRYMVCQHCLPSKQGSLYLKIKIKNPYICFDKNSSPLREKNKYTFHIKQSICKSYNINIFISKQNFNLFTYFCWQISFVSNLSAIMWNCYWAIFLTYSTIFINIVYLWRWNFSYYNHTFLKRQ